MTIAETVNDWGHANDPDDSRSPRLNGPFLYGGDLRGPEDKQEPETLPSTPIDLTPFEQGIVDGDVEAMYNLL